MIEAVREHGWDGEWFRRAYDYFGDAGRLRRERRGPDLHRAAGHVRDGRHRPRRRDAPSAPSTPSPTRLGDAARDRAARSPAYTRYHVELGEISSYPPGYKENGGVFCHTNPWIDDRRDACVGNGDRAFDYYLRINPSAREELTDVHRCEPYVYAQMIAGRDGADATARRRTPGSPGRRPGTSSRSPSGSSASGPSTTACGSTRACPSEWDGFRAVRRFRGATYRIAVGKPVGITGRITSLLVDGRQIDGNIVAPAPEGSDVRVEGTIA